MNSPLHIIVLAAGQGKRMLSSHAKVLMPLAGQALINHVLDTAQQLHPEGICIVRSPHDEELHERVSSQYPHITWAIQQEAKGTADAVEMGLSNIPDNARVLILYADVPLLKVSTLERLLAHQHQDLVVLTGYTHQPTGYGRIIRNNLGNIMSIVEEKTCTPQQKDIQEINLGVYYTLAKKLRCWMPHICTQTEHQERYLTDIIEIARQYKATLATEILEDSTEALGANTKQELAFLERRHQKEQAQKLLQQGVHLYDPERLDVRGHLVCGRDVSIDVNCVFIGHVTLDDHVVIGPHCVIHNAHIGQHTHISAFTHIDNSHVGSFCHIGPYARLRADSKISHQVHIGNFVETKAAHIDARTKAGHLSYLGNCVIGCDVNIGAGTITCNYNGINKNITTIEEHAFIGSGSELVAPVTVGKHATIAAGTTLTKDAPAEALTVRRATQKSIAAWSRQRRQRSKKPSSQ